ncbi:putative nucleoredoxin 2 isoform X1 [Capsicum galapagoense]
MEELEKKNISSTSMKEEEEEEEIDNSFVPVYHSFSSQNYHSHVASGVDYLSILASKHGDFLLSSAGDQVKVSELEGKVVGLYFSANWYSPCTKFTNLLVNVYQQLKECSNVNLGFEIVFVSSDEDLNAFNAYRSSMPWLAIPFSDLATRRALTQKFDVEGIPCLVILQPNDNKLDSAVIKDGVELVYRYGVQAFPFTRERLEELREKEKEKHDSQTLSSLLTHEARDFLLGHPSSKQVPVASLKGKTVGLYFSAQWCIPAKKFTPRLVSVYEKIKQQLEGKEEEDFEIVFVSSDHNQVEFATYFETMPWLTIPFDDPTIKALAKYFDIRGIPSLVVLGPDGKTVTKQGRSLVNLYKENAYPFTKSRVGILEKQMDEIAKGLPKTETHSGHRHELTLVPEGHGGGAFICCDCDEQGYGWAYQCLECGYEVHPKCVKPVRRGPDN